MAYDQAPRVTASFWLFACLAACTPRAEPDATAVESTPGVTPTPTPVPVKVTPEPDLPTFATLPEPVRTKLELQHAIVELPPDYRVEVNEDGQRVDFIARPPSGEFALLYDFGATPTDSSALEPLLGQLASAFTHNYAREDQPIGASVVVDPKIAKQLGGEQLLQTCFVPAEYLGSEFCCGVSLALFRRDIGLMMLLVLTNERNACTPELGIDPTIHGFSFKPGPPEPSTP